MQKIHTFYKTPWSYLSSCYGDSVIGKSYTNQYLQATGRCHFTVAGDSDSRGLEAEEDRAERIKPTVRAEAALRR